MLSGPIENKRLLLIEALSYRGRLNSLEDITGVNGPKSYESLSDATYADLRDADLSYANLKGAIITDEQLASVKSLKGATMPHGSIHP
jgi:uncharacterized protein YjbI with pentapeptide repeats